MKITEQQVVHVANLARLTMNDEEKELFTTQLNDILMYVDILKSADTGGIEPMSHAMDATEAFREDRVLPSIGIEAALANAPDSDGSAFKVPKIIE